MFPQNENFKQAKKIPGSEDPNKKKTVQIGFRSEPREYQTKSESKFKNTRTVSQPLIPKFPKPKIHDPMDI